MVEHGAPCYIRSVGEFVDAETCFTAFADESVGGVEDRFAVPGFERGATIDGGGGCGHVITLSAPTHEVHQILSLPGEFSDSEAQGPFERLMIPRTA